MSLRNQLCSKVELAADGRVVMADVVEQRESDGVGFTE